MAPFRIDFYKSITVSNSYKISAKLKTKIYNLDDFFKNIKSTSAFFSENLSDLHLI